MTKVAPFLDRVAVDIATGSPARPSVFAPIRIHRTFETIIERIVDAIDALGLTEGDRLPNERDMARLMDVSRPTLRQALRILETSGVLRVKPGQAGGVFVASEMVPVDVIGQNIALEVGHVTELIATRRLVEPIVYHLAAENASPPELDRVADAIRLMEAHRHSAGMTQRADGMFHRRIAHAARNQILLRIMTSIYRDLDPLRGSLSHDGARALHMIDVHTRQLDAIRRRDHTRLDALLEETFVDLEAEFQVHNRLAARWIVAPTDKEPLRGPKARRHPRERNNMMRTLKYKELEVLVADTDRELGEAAAEDLASVVKMELAEKPEIAIIMALGAAQDAFYAALRARTDIEWSRITVLHVDTYMGVAEAWPQSGASRMRKHLLDHVKPKAFFPMQGDHEPVEEELARYTALYNEVDPVLCVVGIGNSGHLAFNDPPADFDTRDIIRVVFLDDTTRAQVQRAGIFRTLEEVPRYGLSLTMHALLKPSRVLALVHDADKAPIIKRVVEGPVTFMCPASLLQTAPHAKLYLNRPAAAELEALS